MSDDKIMINDDMNLVTLNGQCFINLYQYKYESEKLKKQVLKLKDDWTLKRAELNSANQNISILTQTKDSLERDKEVLEKALELACREVPSHHCPCPLDKVDMTQAYGSDTPVYIYEGGCDCEDGSNCLYCCINYFKEQAVKELGDK